MGYSLAFRGRAGATTAIRRCPARLSGAVDIFCNLPSPKWTRIDFGGGDLVWGWLKRRNQGIIRRAVDFEGEPVQRRRFASDRRVCQGR